MFPIRLTRLGAAICLLLGLTTLFAPSTAAQSEQTSAGPKALVLQINGLLDPLVANLVDEGIGWAEAEGSPVIVLQINSTGSVLGEDDLNVLARRIAGAEVPVAVWVGPSGARALGEWAELASLADRVGIATGSRFGELASTSVLDPSIGADWGDAAPALKAGWVGDEQAFKLGITEGPAPVIGEFLVSLSDFGVETFAEGENTKLATVVRFEGLSLVDQQLHTVASPPVAYLLFVIGLALLVFEFYTAGVGVAGVVGAIMLLLGCYGLATLPINTWALVLLIFSMLAFSVDVQTGVPRFWSGVGLIAFSIGTIFLYRDGVSMSWIPMVVGIVGIALMMFTGMPTMVRTRFSTPTIGREWMIGQLGEAVDAVAPDGVVRIDEGLWRARTNRATPIEAGDAIRVTAVEGLILEVEPETGGARDYRERRTSGDDNADASAENADASAENG